MTIWLSRLSLLGLFLVYLSVVRSVESAWDDENDQDTDEDSSLLPRTKRQAGYYNANVSMGHKRNMSGSMTHSPYGGTSKRLQADNPMNPRMHYQEMYGPYPDRRQENRGGSRSSNRYNGPEREGRKGASRGDPKRGDPWEEGMSDDYKANSRSGGPGWYKGEDDAYENQGRWKQGGPESGGYRGRKGQNGGKKQDNKYEPDSNHEEPDGKDEEEIEYDSGKDSGEEPEYQKGESKSGKTNKKGSNNSGGKGKGDNGQKGQGPKGVYGGMKGTGAGGKGEGYPDGTDTKGPDNDCATCKKKEQVLEECVQVVAAILISALADCEAQTAAAPGPNFNPIPNSNPRSNPNANTKVEAELELDTTKTSPKSGSQRSAASSAAMLMSHMLATSRDNMPDDNDDFIYTSCKFLISQTLSSPDSNSPGQTPGANGPTGGTRQRNLLRRGPSIPRGIF